MKSITSILLVILFFGLFYADLKAQSDTTKKEELKTTMVMAKSPKGAIFRSLALPGWGQLYVESYWKAPIFFAASGTLVYFIVSNQIKFNDYENRLSIMLKTDTDYNITKLYKEYYRDNRDMSGFYLLAVYILAAVDAYVGAHLYDFNVSDNLAMNVGILPAPVPSVVFCIKF